MRTISNVHSPEERLEMRRLGEQRAVRSQWRLVACITILRTSVTRILPLAGAAGWWIVPVCLTPGLVLYLLGCLSLKRRGGTPLVQQPVICILASVALFADGLCSMTALVTMFTEGIGAQGTQLALAVVTAGMLLFCLNREGLARGIYALRLPLLVLAAVAVCGYAAKARVDHLFPMLGSGTSSFAAAFKAGLGMGWVFLLPLMKPADHRRTWEPMPVVLLCSGLLLALCLCIPHEQIILHHALGECMVQTVSHLGPVLRLGVITLWMSTLFLSLGSVCSLGAGYLLAPWGRSLVWLPWLFAAVLAAAQGFASGEVWRDAAYVEPWLLAVLAVAVVLSFGRKKT